MIIADEHRFLDETPLHHAWPALIGLHETINASWYESTIYMAGPLNVINTNMIDFCKQNVAL